MDLCWTIPRLLRPVNCLRWWRLLQHRAEGCAPAGSPRQRGAEQANYLRNMGEYNWSGLLGENCGLQLRLDEVLHGDFRRARRTGGYFSERARHEILAWR